MPKGLTTLQIYHPNEDLTFPPGTERGRALNTLMDFLTGALIGAKGGQGLSISLGSGGGVASATVTFEDVEGITEIEVNGVAFTMTLPPGNDSQLASGYASAINERDDPRVRGVVIASATANVLTIQAVVPGAGGDTIPLFVSGTGVVPSGSTLSGGGATDFVVLTR